MKGFWKGQSKTAAFLLWEEMFYGKRAVRDGCLFIMMEGKWQN